MGMSMEHPESDAPTPQSGGSAEAYEEQTVSAKTEKKKSDSDEFEMPELEDLLDEAPTAQNLSAEDQELAHQLAESIDTDNPIAIMNFGLEDQEQASSVTRKFLEHVRATDLDSFAEFATQGNTIMKELDFGDLKPNMAQRVINSILPGRAGKMVEEFFAKHQQLSEILDERNQAYADEKLKLEEARTQAATQIEESVHVYQNTSKKVGALELAYAIEKRKVKKFKADNKDTQDPEKLRQMTRMDKGLTLQARRLNTLKAGKTEINNATRTFQEQVDAIDLQIENINDQKYFNELVWNNTALMLLIDQKTKGSVNAVKFTRKTLEKLLEDRADSVADTVLEILEEAKAGVVDVSVLEAVTMKNIEMNLARVKGYHSIREKMAATGEVMQNLERELNKARELAAASTSEELDALEEHYESAKKRFGGSRKKEEEQ
jgi:uncharacterized protein YaaN involved in tellurite resistance